MVGTPERVAIAHDVVTMSPACSVGLRSPAVHASLAPAPDVAEAPPTPPVAALELTAASADEALPPVAALELTLVLELEPDIPSFGSPPIKGRMNDL